MKIIIDTNLWISFMLGRKITTMRTLLTSPTLEIYHTQTYSFIRKVCRHSDSK